MQSCIYTGEVEHCRFKPLKHHFRYRLYMLYIDLQELPELRRQGLVPAKLSFASFRETDHLNLDPAETLDNKVRGIVESETGSRPTGPIRLLTQLRYFGYYFSPLNLYYIFDDSGSKVELVVAEVSNTPWNEKHCYVLWQGNQTDADSLQFRHPKQFHVSPFMGMNVDYLWNLTEPDESLRVDISNREEGSQLFHAWMQLERKPLTKSRRVFAALRFPWMTAQISGAIYWQALKLWWKKCPTYSHPKKLSAPLTK